MVSKKLTGIVLSLKDGKDADKYVTLLTKEEGKIMAYAKGVKRPTSKKRGVLVVGSLVEIEVIEKQNGFLIITEAGCLNSYKDLKKDLNKIANLLFLCEAVTGVSAWGMPQPGVFSLFKKEIESLEDGKYGRKSRQRFVQKLLAEIGFIESGESIGNSDNELALVLNRMPSSVRIGKILVYGPNR